MIACFAIDGAEVHHLVTGTGSSSKPTDSCTVRWPAELECLCDLLDSARVNLMTDDPSEITTNGGIDRGGTLVIILYNHHHDTDSFSELTTITHAGRLSKGIIRRAGFLQN